jgi:hypothetical protein
MAKTPARVLKKRFLAHLATAEVGGVVTYAAQKTPIDRSLAYIWRGKDPKFATEMDAAVEKGRELRADVAENALFKNVLEGNVTAQIFTLKSLRPGTYGDKVEGKLVGPNGGPIEVEMPGLSSWLKTAKAAGNGETE